MIFRIILLLTMTTPLAAEEIPLNNAADLNAWEQLNFDNITPNEWNINDGNLVVKSENAASMLYKNVNILPTDNNSLSWKWKAETESVATDLTQKGGDDRLLSMYVSFQYDPSTASFSEKMKRLMVEAIAGKDAPGRTIQYVFGGQQDRGTEFESPYTSAGANIVLRPASSEIGKWYSEKVNFMDDYKRIFGANPIKVLQIAVFSDTDDSKMKTSARLADIVFTD